VLGSEDSPAVFDGYDAILLIAGRGKDNVAAGIVHVLHRRVSGRINHGLIMLIQRSLPYAETAWIEFLDRSIRIVQPRHAAADAVKPFQCGLETVLVVLYLHVLGFGESLGLRIAIGTNEMALHGVR